MNQIHFIMRKHILSLILFLSSSIYAFALDPRPFSTQQEIIAYFEYAESIDALEGIYSTKTFLGNTKIHESYRAIVSSKSEKDVYYIYSISSGGFAALYKIDGGQGAILKKNGKIWGAILRGESPDRSWSGSEIRLGIDADCDFHIKEGREPKTGASYKEIICCYKKIYAPQPKAKVSKPAKWSGTGFALNNGYVVTNFHVVDGAKIIAIRQVREDGVKQSYNASVVATDKTNDIAILKINDASFKGFGGIPYKIKSTTSEVGESVWALGYPMTDIMGDEVKFTDGKISAKSGVDGMTNVYQISVPIQPGNSGGPLFDMNGNIVGITSSGLNRDLQTENVNYAVKISYLKLLVDDTLTASILPQGTALQGQSLTTQIKLAKRFVFFIECTR